MPCCDDPCCECNNPVCSECGEQLFGWEHDPCDVCTYDEYEHDYQDDDDDDDDELQTPCQPG